MCVSFYYKFYVFFYYKFILIDKFIKHNRANHMSYDVKYFDFHLLFNFLQQSSIRLVFFIFILQYIYIYIIKISLESITRFIGLAC